MHMVHKTPAVTVVAKAAAALVSDLLILSAFEDDDFDVRLADVEDRDAAAHGLSLLERFNERRRPLGWNRHREAPKALRKMP